MFGSVSRRVRRVTLPTQLLLLVLLASLPGAILFVVTVGSLRRDLRRDAERHAATLAELLAEQEASAIEFTELFLAALGRANAFLLRGGEPCAELLGRLLQTAPHLQNIGVVRPDGSVACSALAHVPGIRLNDRSWFVRGFEQRAFVVGEYQVGRITGVPTLNVASPIFAPDGEVAALAFAALDLAWFQHVASNARLPDGATVTLTDRNGTVLASFPDSDDLVGRTMSDSPVVRAMLARRERDVEIESLDGQRRIHHVKMLGDSLTGGAYLAVGFRTDQVFAASNRLALFSGLGLLVAVVLAVLLVRGAGGSWIVRPARALLAAADRVAQGDASARTGIRGDDELGRAAQAFDRMADMIERSRAELKRRERHYRSLVEQAADGILVADASFNIVQVNPALRRILGLAPEDAPPELHTLLGTGHDEVELAHTLMASAVRPIVVSSHARAGAPIALEITTASIDDGAFQLIVRDVTARKRAESELLRSRAQLKRLANRISGTVEEERRRIAREVHDELGQQIMRLKLDVSWLRSRVQDEDAAERLSALGVVLDETSATVRRIASELRPSVLDDLGLAAAVEWQVADFGRRTGIEVHVCVEESARAPSSGAATALYRILQEALTNVARHAHADRVEVHLGTDGASVALEVVDDGRGIRAGDAADPAKLGLLGMRERAEAFGGTLEIDNVGEHGTRVRARIPIDAAETARIA